MNIGGQAISEILLLRSPGLKVTFFTGIWTSSFYLGNFVGPTFGGILVDYYGFRKSSVVVFGACCFSALVDIIDCLYINYFISEKSEEYQPIK